MSLFFKKIEAERAVKVLRSVLTKFREYANEPNLPIEEESAFKLCQNLKSRIQATIGIVEEAKDKTNEVVNSIEVCYTSATKTKKAEMQPEIEAIMNGMQHSCIARRGGNIFDST